MSELVNRMDENGSGHGQTQAKLAETVRCLFVCLAFVRRHIM